MERYGSDLVVDLLQEYGFEYAALNPGSSFRGLHDSIVNYGGNRPEIIECPHEEIAVAIAHGYARVRRRPMAAILHDVVGLLHGSMAIYYAYLDRCPVLVLGATGPMDPSRRRTHIDWIHTAVAQSSAVRDFTKWDHQPVGAEDVVDSFARAYRIATTEPQGPVYLCYDAAFQEDPLPRPPTIPPPAEVTPTRLAGEGSAVEQLAGWLVQARNPVLVADSAGRHPDAFRALVELSELLALPVMDRGARLNFPTAHPLNLTGADDLLQDCDLLLAVDVRDLHGAISRVDRVARRTHRVLPDGCRIAEIGLGDLGIRSWSEEFEKLQPVHLSILGDSAVVLADLLVRCRQRLGANRPPELETRAARLERRHREVREAGRRQALESAEAEPIATAHLVHEIGEAIRGTDWVLAANTVHGWARRLWDFDHPDRHPGKSLGTATQIGMSLGVALAHRGSERLVVDIQPDGDLMFDVAALWVATHHRIPLLVVMYDNRSYYNDWEHQVLIARQRGRDESQAWVGMEIDRPAPDYAGLARAFGWYAEGPIEKPKDVRPAVCRAREVVLGEGRPALVDVVTQFR